MKAFVLAENSNAACELCAGARKKASEVILVAAGTSAPLGVADKVLHIEIPQGSAIDDAYLTINTLFDAEQPEIVFVEPTRRMKVLAGRLANHAQTSVLTDVLAFEEDSAVTTYYGGVAQRKSRPATSVALFTIGAGTFDAVEAIGSDAVEEVVFMAPERAVVVKKVEALPKSDIDLIHAEKVVAVGRGFAVEEELSLAREVCEKMRAELACSRPLTEGVDWMPREAYVGVSGQVIAPKVYLAVGISGQMQHMVGADRSGTLFAINKDKNAPIFKQVDVGIVGDLKTVLPALAAKL